MFNNPVKPDSRQDEGTVLQVDAVREVCKIVTMMGQKLDNVQWLRPYGGNERYGDRFTPRLGDKVLVNHGLGYPIIIGFLPRSQNGGQSFPLSIGFGETSVDTGNYAPTMSTLTADASKPKDMLLGDRVIVSQAGGMLAVLRAGSVLLRSSRAAEILLCRLGDLVRIVGRNYEQFTDLSSDVYRNFKGRVYRYFGVANTFSKSRDEDYSYHQYYGDTAAAEAVKTMYASPPESVPALNDVIFKEQVTGVSSAELMRRTLNLSGHEEVYITGGGTFTRMKATGGVITLSFGDQHTVSIDSSNIHLHHGGGADVRLDASGVYSSFSGHHSNIVSSGVYMA